MSSTTKQPEHGPWLSVIGIGDDGIDGLSPRAANRLAAARTVFGGKRHLELVKSRAGQDCIAWPSPLDRAIPWIEARRGQPVAVLGSGDPNWYGIGATLARTIPPDEIETFPAPSAFSLAAARMGWPLQDCRCLSAHGRALERVRPWLHPGARLLILSWDGTTPTMLARFLQKLGFGPSRMTVLEHLGGAHERRIEDTAAGWSAQTVADLNTIAVTCACVPGAQPLASVAGRPDDLFDHDGQITKCEVRAVTLAALAPGRGQLLWDVGAGSGAIGIEWMLADASNRAIAVERNADRARRISDNARHLGVPDMVCVQGPAPAALEDLEPPDAVFIGGGLSEPGLVAHCHGCLPSGGRLVANSVTVEGDTLLAQAAGHYGGSLTRFSVARAERLGGFRGWAPLRPVTIWATVIP